MTKFIESIPASKAEWDTLRPLSTKDARRLWQKLRLEWNYHSNHIEGNTLTYGETELLLIHGATHGNHTIREYEEMQAHDVGIAHLRELAEDRTRVLGEGDIRNLNKIILKEPFWKPAQTESGHPTRKRIVPGDYKTSPNNVITASGGLFEFASPQDVPARMQKLLVWLEHELADEASTVISIVSRLHHEFVLIHPFDDGNGRVARMLVNYVLMRLDYLPIIIPTERKKDYLAALRLADVGEIFELENFLAPRVVRGLELGIKAAKGESLEEPGDVEKEIAVFIKRQKATPSRNPIRSSETVSELYESSFKPLLKRLFDKMRVFEPLFAKCSVSTNPPKSFPMQDPMRFLENCLVNGNEDFSEFIIHFEFDGYLGNTPRSFRVDTIVDFELSALSYTWSIEGVSIISKSYSEPVLADEAADFVEKAQSAVFDIIKSQVAAAAGDPQ